MSAYPYDASGEEDAGEVIPGDSPAALRFRNRLELHWHRGPVDLDLCLKGSEPRFAQAGEPVRGNREYRSDRRIGHGHEPFRRTRRSRERGEGRTRAFRGTTETPASAPASQRGTPAADSFWSALHPSAQDEFRSRAELRTFAAGARLMREGETANHVAVILRGETEVRVGDQGTERILARRGPGQLIGERAALQVNVRSATVVALGIVQALVMQTADFAAFLSAHPEVLDIVESEVYVRLTEEPPGRADDDGVRPQDGTVAGDEPTVVFRRAQARPFTGENCTVIYTDVVGFSSGQRDDHDRLLIRHDLAGMTHAALKAIWTECFWDDRGDGSLVVVPAAVPTAKVLEYLLVALPIALRQHNENCSSGTRFQLRVALDVGAVVSDDTGVSGQVIINTKRLLDSAALKRAIADGDVPLGLIVSDAVYQYTVEHAKAVTDPATYKRIRVTAGDISLVAWMSLVSSPVQVPRPAFLLAAG